jgi:hypothetical protein
MLQDGGQVGQEPGRSRSAPDGDLHPEPQAGQLQEAAGGQPAEQGGHNPTLSRGQLDRHDQELVVRVGHGLSLSRPEHSF